MAEIASDSPMNREEVREFLNHISDEGWDVSTKRLLGYILSLESKLEQYREITQRVEGVISGLMDDSKMLSYIQHTIDIRSIDERYADKESVVKFNKHCNIRKIVSDGLLKSKGTASEGEKALQEWWATYDNGK
jgi:archaellum biogenesis ATPase FlaH